MKVELPKYPVYKPSGVEWIGQIPDGWKMTQLKRNLSAIDYGISESDNVDGTYGVLKMGHISDGELVFDDLGYVDSVPSSLVLETNDLLFNRTNSLDQIAKVGIFRGTSEDRITFASYLVRLRAENWMVSAFLNYLLNSKQLLGFARKLAIPSINQANLNPTRYGNIPCVTPSQGEQRAIAEFLDQQTARIDRLIADRHGFWGGGAVC